MTSATDDADIRAVIDAFFAAFTSEAGIDDRMAALRTLFLPSAVIVRADADGLTSYDVDAFIAPRAALLSDGSLEGFREWPVDGRIDRFGDIAQWFGSYAKAWRAEGRQHSGRGAKSIQLARTAQGWRISAVAWDDER